MSKALDLTLSIGKKLVGSYSRPNKFITAYTNPRNLTGSWLTAPWCAMFASFVLKAAGVKAGEYAYCPTWVNKFKADKQWGSVPRIGAVAFYDWDGDGLSDHVGIVVKVGAKQVDVLEGNTSSGGNKNVVAIQHRSKGLIMGYGYPDYGTTPSVKTYKVVKGDSLAAIAKKLGLDWQKLYDKNRATVGPNPNVIKAGMTLVI